MFRKIVDTNILYDAWTKNNNTEKALKIINEPICILEGVLYELSNLLKNTEGTNYSCQIISEILNNPSIFQILKVGLKEINEALSIMQKYQNSEPKKDYSLVDTLHFVVAKNYNLPVFTTDERMTYFDAKIKVIKPY